MKKQLIAIGITTAAALLITVLIIKTASPYDFSLFIILPIFIGLAPVIILGRQNLIVRGEAIKTGLAALGAYGLLLFLLALEGAMCLVMSIPLVIPLTILGSMLGFSFIKLLKGGSIAMLLIISALLPTMAFMASPSLPEAKPITTSVIISASQERIWPYVVAFPPLQAPKEFMFNMGIAFPISASIIGDGPGAVRLCSFNTGDFVEPIEVWDAPNLLRFKVTQQPAPMNELSIWKINPPHMQGTLVSEKGEFKLTALPDGRTKLEGTTWYYNNLKPLSYWRLWSDFIIHRIHLRVLNHVKQVVEQRNTN